MGIEADEDRVDALLKELDGKDIAEVIAAGCSKLASVPSGGGAMVASGGEPALHLHSYVAVADNQQINGEMRSITQKLLFQERLLF